MSEKRKDTRFDDIGRVDAPDICIFPGILVDISQLGCKIRFPVSVSPDMETDYELKITPSRKSDKQSFILIGHPMWNTNEASLSEIGFKILRSPGTRQLESYVKKLQESEDAYNDSTLIKQLCLS